MATSRIAGLAVAFACTGGTAGFIALAYSGREGSCEPSCPGAEALAAVLVLGGLGAIAGVFAALVPSGSGRTRRLASSSSALVFLVGSLAFLFLSLSPVAFFYVLVAVILCAVVFMGRHSDAFWHV